MNPERFGFMAAGPPDYKSEPPLPDLGGAINALDMPDEWVPLDEWESLGAATVWAGMTYCGKVKR